jgi:hypothetical protein
VKSSDASSVPDDLERQIVLSSLLCLTITLLSDHHIHPGQFIFSTFPVITSSRRGLRLDVRLVSLCPVYFPPSFLEGLRLEVRLACYSMPPRLASAAPSPGEWWCYNRKVLCFLLSIASCNKHPYHFRSHEIIGEREHVMVVCCPRVRENPTE